jgi:hypothetical protein
VGSRPALEGSPIAVYPPLAVDDNGKRFEAKSKPEDVE